MLLREHQIKDRKIDALVLYGISRLQTVELGHNLITVAYEEVGYEFVYFLIIFYYEYLSHSHYSLNINTAFGVPSLRQS